MSESIIDEWRPPACPHSPEDRAQIVEAGLCPICLKVRAEERMSAPGKPFADWPRKKLERHAAMLRKTVLRYRGSLEQITGLAWTDGASQSPAKLTRALRIARRALGK